MARIRTIKPDFTLDEELGKLPIATRYFFENFWCHCDRKGRAQDCPLKLKALIFPWDHEINVDSILDELSPKFITRYEIEGKRYLQVNTFEKHQRPNIRESESDIPAPEKSCLHVKKHASTLDKGKGNGREEGKGSGKGGGRELGPPPRDKQLPNGLEDTVRNRVDFGNLSYDPATHPDWERMNFDVQRDWRREWAAKANEDKIPKCSKCGVAGSDVVRKRNAKGMLVCRYCEETKQEKKNVAGTAK